MRLIIDWARKRNGIFLSCCLQFGEGKKWVSALMAT